MLELGRELATEGHRVDIYCPRIKDTPKAELLNTNLTLYRLGPLARPSHFPRRALRKLRFALIRRPLRRLAPESTRRIEWAWHVYRQFQKHHAEHAYDIVESSDWGSSCFFLSILNRSVPMVVRLHRSMYFSRLDKGRAFTLDHRIVRRLERIALLRADAVTSPSQFILTHTFADWLKRDLEVFSRQTPTAVIRNGTRVIVYSS